MRGLPLALIVAGFLGTAERAIAVDAADVADRETLKDFVLEALSLLESAQDEAEQTSVLDAFRHDARWRHGPIYIFIVDLEGTNFFHPVRPERQGVNNIDQEDANGLKFVRQAIDIARAGGGFSEYFWDNPAIEGEDESLKVAYIAPIEIDGVGYFIGAGFHPIAETGIEATSWGRLKGQVLDY